MPASPQLIFVPRNGTFTSNAADTIVSGGSDTISMLAPGALAFGLNVYGSPADMIIAGAADLIVGASSPTFAITGALLEPETIVAAASGAILWSSGITDVINSGGDNTIISQPRQVNTFQLNSMPAADTIFAAASGGTYFMQGPDTFVAEGAGSSTVIGSVSFGRTIFGKFLIPVLATPTIFGGAENVLYFAQPTSEVSLLHAVQPGTPTFMFDPQSGDSTIITTTTPDTGVGGISTSAGEAFVHDGGILNVVGSGSANLLVAGEGNATINAAGSTGYNTFFAGSGNASLVGGSGADAVAVSGLTGSYEENLFEASTGSTTIVGGSGRDWYQFTSGNAGGVDLIQNWDANDQLQLFGYGANPIASEAVSSGSTFITLSDGTRITLQGISDLNTAQVSSY